MTAVNPSGGTLDPFSVVLMNVAEFHILSATVPAVVGDMIDAEIGIDEITALRPPPASIWTGASSMNWVDGGNWTGTVPGATSGATNTDTASFSQNAANSTLVVDAGRNVQNITFDTANVNSLVIGTTAGPSLLLTAGGTIQTTSTVVFSQTINAPLVLGGDYTFNSSAANSSARLLFGGGITPSATSGTTTLTLAGSNTGANTIAGIVADNGAGSLAVVKNGTGLWILSGANKYSGGTTVMAGTLRFERHVGLAHHRCGRGCDRRYRRDAGTCRLGICPVFRRLSREHHEQQQCAWHRRLWHASASRQHRRLGHDAGQCRQRPQRQSYHSRRARHRRGRRKLRSCGNRRERCLGQSTR